MIDQSIDFIEEQIPQFRLQIAEATRELTRFHQERQATELAIGTRNVLARAVALESELEALRFQEEELAQWLTPNHPEYRGIIQRRARAELRLSELRDELAHLPPLEQELFALNQRLESALQLERMLQSRAEQLRIILASSVGNIRVLEPAESASLVGPDRRMPVLIGSSVGLVLAMFGLLALNLFRRGIDDGHAIVQAGLPLFGTINRVKGLRSSSAPLYQIAKTAPRDVTAEGFVGLRTGLQFSLAAARTRSRSLMITSSSPDVGKSFIALNLALVTSRTGARVLLIDADLRRGKLHRQFGLSRHRPGLAEILAGSARLDEVIHVDPETGVDFIGTGAYPENPADLLISPAFTRLMATDCERYDLVILDAPPVLAVTDPVIIARATGMSLLVVQHLKTTVTDLEACQRMMASSGARLSGAILNNYDAKASRYGAYGAAYSGYGVYRYE